VKSEPANALPTHEDALKKAVEVCEQFRIQQDRDYISNYDETMTEYL